MKNKLPEHPEGHTTFAVNKQGHLLSTHQIPEELDRSWTIISEKDYWARKAEHDGDGDRLRSEAAAFIAQSEADRAALRASAAAKLGVTEDELRALLS